MHYQKKKNKKILNVRISLMEEKKFSTSYAKKKRKKESQGHTIMYAQK